MRSLLSLVFLVSILSVAAGAVEPPAGDRKIHRETHPLELYRFGQPAPSERAPRHEIDHAIPFVTERFGLRWAPYADRGRDDPLGRCLSRVAIDPACY